MDTFWERAVCSVDLMFYLLFWLCPVFYLGQEFGFRLSQFLVIDYKYFLKSLKDKKGGNDTKNTLASQDVATD